MNPTSSRLGGALELSRAPDTTPEVSRRALRRFASGVTVLTVSSRGLRHGTTVSALLPISRDPLVLGVCLQSSSTFTDMVLNSGRFSVNVLSSEQVAVARQFATAERAQGDAQFATVDWVTDELTGAPLIGGCLAHVACSLNECQRIGDHDLLTAEVLGGLPGPGVPLLTFAGKLAPDELTAPSEAYTQS